MTQITLVTGNKNKLKEIEAIAALSNIKLSSRQIDLIEIQSLDIQEVFDAKVEAAYDIVKAPVIVEDVSAGLDDLGGLPGTFYKFFRQTLGDSILVKLAAIADTNSVTIRCMTAYFDGTKKIYGIGEIHGRAVPARGSHGFGFDPFILPNGASKTLAELSADEKNAVSHRAMAFKQLFSQL